MDFNLSSEQQELQKTLSAMCEAELAPAAGEVDIKGAFPAESWIKLSEACAQGTMVPKEFGGKGQDLISGIIVIEEASAACASTGMALATSMFCAGKAIEIYGTESIKKEYLPGMATGKVIGAFATTEVSAGSDLFSITTTAKKDNGDWIINGEKSYVTNAASADFIIVLARTAEGKDSAYSLILVPSKSQGVSIGEPIRTMGLRGAVACPVTFKDVRVPQADIIGSEGAGIKVAEDIIDYTRLATSAVAIGISRSAFVVGKEYAEVRTAFGRQIGKYQEIAFKVTDLHVDMDYARQLLYHAAWQKGEGMKCATMVAAAKVAAGEVAVANADRAVSILGGKGCMQGETAERLYRDAKLTQISGGTPEILRQVIAKELLA